MELGLPASGPNSLCCLFNHSQTRGFPQGSFSRPALCNLFVDEALNYNYTADMDVQAFPDEFQFVVAADSETALGRRDLEALEISKTGRIGMASTSELKNQIPSALQPKKRTLHLLGWKKS
ncbi:hypothetical protein AVEN_80796-1 [Araneus ventricosus]|uniref:Reverse transcriptase domain-containing protein n=1 Tax=Araneus ventricosus TaxID=182803 RepID=A0A4Y2FIF7_ARAVE|nr:hypothetical protein AVEN_80796-1 [Araneus ventricosus]